MHSYPNSRFRCDNFNKIPENRFAEVNPIETHEGCFSVKCLNVSYPYLY